jgi:hypothetical protein
LLQDHPRERVHPKQVSTINVYSCKIYFNNKSLFFLLQGNWYRGDKKYFFMGSQVIGSWEQGLLNIHLFQGYENKKRQ